MKDNSEYRIYFRSKPTYEDFKTNLHKYRNIYEEG